MLDPMSGTRAGRERGWTILEVLLVLAVVGLLLAIALPNFHAARIRNDEAAAVRALREIAKAEDLFRAGALVDVNADGRGEYALLQELCGDANPRSYAGGPRAGAAPAPLPQFRLKATPDGDYETCGYRFRIVLPGEKGVGVREGSAGAAGRIDPRLAADLWSVYAWPVRREGFIPAATGGRTFFANQAGEVLAADGDYSAVAAKEGASPRAPEPGAAFQAPGPLDTITGAPAVGTLGRDGCLWSVAR
jgi:prepilin-type N-terminal cleavage/methylation domain-containing protein